jgi:hypothetical protein
MSNSQTLVDLKIVNLITFSDEKEEEKRERKKGLKGFFTIVIFAFSLSHSLSL